MGSVVGDDGGANKVGMAPGARWIGCRNMDAGSGKPSTYLDCFEWLLAPYPQGGDPQVDGKPEMAPNVINNSWGCDETEGCQGQEFVQAIINLETAGILMVASAGNSGSACSTINAQPASVSDHTLSVGAHDHRTNAIAGFSSRGPSTLDGKIGPDVSAPGVSIRSSLRGGGYGSMSGTSMAGPHVVGEVALLWSAVPALKGKLAQTTDVITHSAKATTSTQTCGGVSGSSIPNNTFGYGLIDAYAAVIRGQSLSLAAGD
jgi:subtilisin family serine protease